MRTYKIPESVLVVIYSNELDVLLVERAGNPGFWQSVTGSRATPEETLLETAVREVREETGISVVFSSRKEKLEKNEVSHHFLQDWQITNRYEIYPSWRYRYAPGITENTEHVFGLCVPRDIQIFLEPSEHLQYVWLPYVKAAEKCFSSSNADAILQLPGRLQSAAVKK